MYPTSWRKAARRRDELEAPDSDGALGGGEEPRDDPDERRLAGAVRAEDRVHGARGDVERDVAENLELAESVRDVVGASTTPHPCRAAPPRRSRPGRSGVHEPRSPLGEKRVCGCELRAQS